MSREVTSVRAVERALNIMKSFSVTDIELTLSEISEKVNLAKSTVHRILSTLEKEDYIEQDQKNGKYRLSFEAIRLGVIAYESIDLRGTAYPEMKRLSEKCGQTSNLYVIQGYQRLCIEHVSGPQYVKRYSYLGALLPLYAGASGKVLLAYKSEEWLDSFFEKVKLEKLTPNTITSKEEIIKDLKKIKSQGYAFSSTERDQITASMSAPIFDYSGKMMAGLTVSGPSVMFIKENLEVYLPYLLEAADKISERLGYEKRLL